MLSGMELIILAIAGVALLIWGPSKIPELAKGLGKAKSEFEKASKGYVTESTVSDNVRNTPNDDSLLVIAASLGLTTQGKTKEQILQEIVTTAKANKTTS